MTTCLLVRSFYILSNMPSLPKRNKRKQDSERPRVPSGDRSMYNATWANVSKLYRKENPLCEACLLRGIAKDASPGGYKGVTDHIVSVTNGGARMDERNFATLCKQCHDRKSWHEGKGWRPESYGNFGAMLPIDRKKALQDGTK